MALNQMGVGLLISAEDRASVVFGRVGAQINSLTNQMRRQDLRVQASVENFQRFAAQLADVGKAMAALGIQAAKTSGEFDGMLVRIEKVLGGGQSTIDKVSEAGLSATELGFKPVEALNALDAISRRGFDTAQSIEALRSSMALARVGQLDLAKTGLAVASVMKALGLAADQAGSIVDRVDRIARSTGFDIKDFGSSVSLATSAAKAAGQQLNSMLVMMGLLRNMTIGASRSATSYSQALLRISSNLGVQNLLQDKFGVAIRDQMGELRQFTDIMGEVEQKLSDDTDARAKQLDILRRAFGTRGYRAVNAFLNANTIALSKNTTEVLRGADAARELEIQAAANSKSFFINGKEILNTRENLEQFIEASGGLEKVSAHVSDMNDRVFKGEEAQRLLRMAIKDSGGVMRQAQEIMANFADQSRRLEAELERLQVVFGATFGKVLTPVLTAANNLIKDLTRVFAELPPGVRDVISAFFSMSSAILIVLGTMFAFSLAWALLAPIITNAGTIFLSMGSTLLKLAPILIGLGALITILSSKTDAQGNAFQRLTRIGERIKLFFEILVSFLREGKIQGELFFRAIKDRPVLNFAANIAILVERFKDFIKGFREGAQEILKAWTKTDGALSKVAQTLEPIRGMFKSLSGSTKSFAESLDPEAFRNSGASIATVIGKLAEKFILFVDFVISTAIAVREAWRGAGDTLKDAFGGALVVIFNAGMVLAKVFVFALGLALRAVGALIGALSLNDWSFFGVIVKAVAGVILFRMVTALLAWVFATAAAKLQTLLLNATLLLMQIRTGAIVLSLSNVVKWMKNWLGITKLMSSAQLFFSSVLKLLKLEFTPIIFGMLVLVGLFTGALSPLQGFTIGMLMLALAFLAFKAGASLVLVKILAIVGAVVILTVAIMKLISVFTGTDVVGNFFDSIGRGLGGLGDAIGFGGDAGLARISGNFLGTGDNRSEEDFARDVSKNSLLASFDTPDVSIPGVTIPGGVVRSGRPDRSIRSPSRSLSSGGADSQLTVLAESTIRRLGDVLGSKVIEAVRAMPKPTTVVNPAPANVVVTSRGATE